MYLHEMKPSFLSLDSPDNIRCGDMGIEEGTGKHKAGPAHAVSILMQKATNKLALMLDLFC